MYPFTYYYDENGFLTSDGKSVGNTDVKPDILLKLPKFNVKINKWVEGTLPHVWVIDDSGFFIYDEYDIDPRSILLTFTTDELKSGSMNTPQYKGNWKGPGLVTGGIWTDLHPTTVTELDTLKSFTKQVIERDCANSISKGIKVNFVGGTDLIQLRNDKDIFNITRLVQTALLYKTVNKTCSIPLKVGSNRIHYLTPDEIIQIGLKVDEFITVRNKLKWRLKHEIDIAETRKAIDAIEWLEPNK